MTYIDDFISEAERDNRVGDHEALVLKCEPGAWPSGDTYTKLVVGLKAAGGAKADCNLNPIPSEAALAAIKAEGNRGKMRAVASNITLMRQLEQHYGITDPSSLREGDTVFVKTVKTKVDPVTSKGGFIRVIAFLPKGGGAKSTANSSDDTPF